MKTETFTTEDGTIITYDGSVTITKPSGDWEPKCNDKYFYLKDSNKVNWNYWRNDYIDQVRLKNDNVYQTEKEAQTRADYSIAVATVTKAIKKKNNGWVPDWSDRGEYKYLPYHGVNLGVTMYSCNQYTLAYPYCKTREIAQEIIDEYQTELEIIRDFTF